MNKKKNAKNLIDEQAQKQENDVVEINRQLDKIINSK